MSGGTPREGRRRRSGIDAARPCEVDDVLLVRKVRALEEMIVVPVAGAQETFPRGVQAVLMAATA